MDRRVDSIRSELESMNASRRLLDKQIAEKQTALLRSLHQTVGLPDTDALIRELWKYAKPQLRAELTQPQSGTAKGSTGKRYDEDTRIQVRHALEQLHRRPADVRRDFGLSIATLAKWMKQWGISGKRERKQTSGANSADNAARLGSSAT